MWTVHKFGGTSVADADRYRAACEIVLSQRSGEPVAVVVSAMSGVTNALIESVMEVYREANILSGKAWEDMLHKMHTFTDQILVSLLETYHKLESANH